MILWNAKLVEMDMENCVYTVSSILEVRKRVVRVDSMDISDILLSFALSISGGFVGVMFGVWLTRKVMFSADSIMNMADSVLDYAINTKEGQDKLNILGKWVVSNLMSGVKGSVGGLMPKTKDLPGIIAYGLIQKFMPSAFGQEQQQNQQQQSNTPEQPKKNPLL